MQGLIHYLPLLLAELQSKSVPKSATVTTPFDCVMVSGVPQQINGGDCGFLMLKIAEVMQMGFPISSICPKKIPDYRAKWAYSLYVYGCKKAKRKIQF
ncbi:unnamed protein product [Cuscuta epithymum]|uniref:Ubiquitin-like protease family profile domain-containing protein n=1 Tax=Cuscuta epithymum TaxID=186058 RepID=A0AAV0BX59_9ASTE|nr:unnamed protein product [Cuscuta epithymum]